jgi:glycine/D-amino acid oxidase-like deaminating enzyme
MAESFDAVVIGGGFYGLYLAEHLAQRVPKVLLCERGPELMQRASYSNQARVHNGYHYPRSLLTAVRSRVNFPRFLEEFRPAVDDTFEKIYAVGRRFSKVTADQFLGGMRRIGAAIRPAPKDVQAFFDPTYIEGAFVVQEHAFNSRVLRQIMEDRVKKAGIEVRLSTTVQSVQGEPGERVRLRLNGETEVTAGMALCCGYSQLNAPAAGGGLPLVALKHELTELCLVEVPEPLRAYGITVMDGPFFSLMPFPARGLHSLSHVRYTPHFHWYDGEAPYRPAYQVAAEHGRQTAFPHMVRDAARFLPMAAGCVYRDSLWEVKTLLPRSETDDSRPIFFRPHFGVPGYHLVMGGKIDNIYDIAEVIDQTFGWSR